GLPRQLDLPDLPSWLGDGSLSLVAHLAGAPGRLAAESFDVTAAALHADGRLVLDHAGDEPRLTGRIGIDTLPLPIPDGGSDVSLPVGILHGWQGALTLDVGSVTAASRAVLHRVAAQVAVADDGLRLE